MAFRFEVGLKPGLRDARGESLQQKVEAFLHIPLLNVHVRTVYTFPDALPPASAPSLQALLADPIIHTTAPPDPSTFDWALEVGFKPGVTDAVAQTAQQAVEDLLCAPLSGPVSTSLQYLLKGSLTPGQLERVGQLVGNPLIHRLSLLSAEDIAGGATPPPLAPFPDVAPRVATHDLSQDLETLHALSARSLWGFSREELDAIQSYFSQPSTFADRSHAGLSSPTDAEMEALAQTWSEHCKHKIFNARIIYLDMDYALLIDSLFKTYIKRATDELSPELGWLVSTFKDNAGIVRFNDRLNLAYKVETHNSPSALDPYGGAMTGILGVNRDTLAAGKGAALLFNTWAYCFASPQTAPSDIPPGLLHPRQVRDGVHQGVIDGGNQMGIPLMRGREVFDPRYKGKPLVYCGTVGIQPTHILGEPSDEKGASPGDLIVMVGGRVGKDGIHGATFSSEGPHQDSPVQAVQIGDPITQKRLADFLLEARDQGLYTDITDNGAGGLSSSVGEMAQSSRGCILDLAKAPLKYPGLQPWEILISESQERMTLAVPPPHEQAFLDMARRRGVEETVREIRRTHL